ncbi:MAG: leucine-rich repeat protein [Acutalibacteraceae bacterium]
MKKMKSLMLLIATILMLVVAFCMSASAAEWIEVPFNENAQYTFDEETAVMVIKGEGKLNGSYFSEICPDHYAPLDDVFGCTCTKGVEDAEPSDREFPGREAASKTKTLIIQEGVTAIDVRAFNGFSSLEVAILPQSLTEIPAGAFHGLKKVHTVVLSNSVEKIGQAAFFNCSNLKNIYMADTLKSVGKNAFYGCDKEFIRIPSSATVEVEQPGSVKNLTVTEQNHIVTFSWEKSENAEGYVVAIDGKKIVTKNTSYTIGKLTPSKNYSVFVTAYLTYNGKTVYGFSSTQSFTTKPEAPKVKVSTTSDTIKLSWSDNNYDCSYIIYLKTSEGNWKVWYVIRGHTFDFDGLNPGTRKTFAVRPISNDYKEVLGDYTIITAATIPATVTAKPASPSKGKITLTWNGVSGDIDGYRVYYKVGNGTYKIYKNYSTVQKLTFSNLKSGTKYTFAVRAGIKTSGGIVWSGYKEVPVTVK